MKHFLMREKVEQKYLLVDISCSIYAPKNRVMDDQIFLVSLPTKMKRKLDRKRPHKNTNSFICPDTLEVRIFISKLNKIDPN